MSEPLTITAIVHSKANPKAAVVKVNGKSVGTLSFRSIEQLGLSVGQAWDETLALRVAEMVEYEALLNRATAWIARRPMSRKQVEEKLTAKEASASGKAGDWTGKKHPHPAATLSGSPPPSPSEGRGISEQIRGRVLARLEELGLIDDRALGRALIEETLRKGPAGPALLRDKLTRRGIAAEVVEELIEQTAGPGTDQLAQATAVARKQMQKMPGLDAATQQRRVAGLLARRGFDPDLIAAVLDDLGIPDDS